MVTLLTVNVGSSSVRLVLYADGQRRAELHLEGSADPVALARAARELGVATPEAVAHRVVHGGERFTRSCRIDAAVEAQIEQLSELAPLHNPPALHWIRAARAAWPAAAQIAVFDTAFFSQLPAIARRYALPAASQHWPIHRYGFHGLAHRYLWQRWAQLGGMGRVITLQLGSGCSVAALADGAPLDTSMGFSPLEGLVMATRCGDVDPGALLYLQRQTGWSIEQLEYALNHDSGLLGVSGVSKDLRALLASSEPAAREAVELFCYRARKYIGAYLAVLGGADAILFGGGVGEHLSSIRATILQGLEWAGVTLDVAANEAAVGREARISTAGSHVAVQVIPVDESLIMAQEAAEAL